MAEQVTNPKPQRLLSCAQCHQRKVKCDRSFPCASCLRTGLRCVPANALAPRPRRRRFAERELLDRLRHYETLLSENHISFDPLHPERDDATSESSVKSEVVDLWHAISQVTLQPDVNHEESDDDNPDDVSLNDHKNARRRNAVIKKAYSNRFQDGGHNRHRDRSADYLLFGQPDTNIDLSASHPTQAHIFRLWQIYLDNVNPLLKVTHIPTLQPRILDAFSNLASVTPSLQALMFSIYCLSVSSLTQDECSALFRSSRKDLLTSYQSACRQALLACNAWRSSNVDSLTALYFYLLSTAPKADPQSLASMFAVLIRITQRMGMHIESTNTKHTALEAEVRRRLWWSLVIFDHRICELTDLKTTLLTPAWDCRIPLNVNDSELRSEMNALPAAHEKPTEALFAIVRSELADSIRHNAFHVNFVNPSLNTIARSRAALNDTSIEGSGLDAIEKTIEGKHLAYCDLEDPLQFMTIWTTRASLARNRLLEHYSRHSTTSVKPTNAERRAAFSSALDMLECDTTLKTSPLAKRYLWFVDLHFPALAHIHLLNGLTRQPGHEEADKAWVLMSDNYEAIVPRRKQLDTDDYGGVHFLTVSFSRVVLQAWDAREAFLKRKNEPIIPPPRMVSDIRSKVMQISSSFPLDQNGRQSNEGTASHSNTVNSSIAACSMNQEDQNDTGRGQDFVDPGSAGFFPYFAEQPMLDVDLDLFVTEMDWGWMGTLHDW